MWIEEKKEKSFFLCLDQRVVYNFLQQINNNKTMEKPVEKPPVKDLDDVLGNLKKWVIAINFVVNRNFFVILDIKHDLILHAHEVNLHVYSNHPVGVLCVNQWESIVFPMVIFQVKIHIMVQYSLRQIEECVLLFLYIPIGFKFNVFQVMNI